MNNVKDVIGVCAIVGTICFLLGFVVGSCATDAVNRENALNAGVGQYNATNGAFEFKKCN